jgi:hypothetical protein
LQQPDVALRFLHRTLKDGTVFLVFNESDKPIDNVVALLGSGSRVEVWDPQTGTSTPATGAVAKSHSSVTVPLKLAPYATQVFVLR